MEARNRGYAAWAWLPSSAWGAAVHLAGVREGRRVLKPLSELWGEGNPWGDVLSGWIPDRELLCSRRNGPASQLALLLARQAVEDAGWGRKELRDAALIVGSSRGNASGWLSRGGTAAHENFGRSQFPAIANLLPASASNWEFAGLITCWRAAVPPGLDAVGMAAMLMRQGVVKRALAIGLDLPLCRELLGTYWASGMLSRNGLNDPYGPLADGMCISEGGAAIALELSSAPGIYVKDYLVNSDAYSPLGMPEDGKSIAALLEAALKSRDGAVPLTVCPHASGHGGE